ncbi:hypothetical protein B0H16DRAFT_1465867 [Mycena metata]|uniref:Uncharacterized protein n=1 Tax=Mycena metata TaxID=1033252 RepID=A0AAD7I9N0_9AGAR|nr:hypothetical protein B0H16DRAFT_1465867 [Mycena metata]
MTRPGAGDYGSSAVGTPAPVVARLPVHSRSSPSRLAGIVGGTMPLKHGAPPRDRAAPLLVLARCTGRTITAASTGRTTAPTETSAAWLGARQRKMGVEWEEHESARESSVGGSNNKYLIPQKRMLRFFVTMCTGRERLNVDSSPGSAGNHSQEYKDKSMEENAHEAGHRARNARPSEPEDSRSRSCVQGMGRQPRRATTRCPSLGSTICTLESGTLHTTGVTILVTRMCTIRRPSTVQGSNRTMMDPEEEQIIAQELVDQTLIVRAG